MTDDQLVEEISLFESGKQKLRLSDPESPTGRLNISPIVLQVLKRELEERKKAKL